MYRAATKKPLADCLPIWTALHWRMPALTRPQKITLGEMRSSGVRGLLIYCADYHCSHSIEISADRWPDHVRLSDLEPLFVCLGMRPREAPISGQTLIGTNSQRPAAPYRRSRAARHFKNSSKSFLRASADAGTTSRRSARNRSNSACENALAFVRRGRSAAFPLPATSIAKPNPVRSAPTRLSATSEHIAEHSFPSKN